MGKWPVFSSLRAFFTLFLAYDYPISSLETPYFFSSAVRRMNSISFSRFFSIILLTLPASYTTLHSRCRQLS